MADKIADTTPPRPATKRENIRADFEAGDPPTPTTIPGFALGTDILSFLLESRHVAIRLAGAATNGGKSEEVFRHEALVTAVMAVGLPSWRFERCHALQVLADR